jgi:hypothetical protein
MRWMKIDKDMTQAWLPEGYDEGGKEEGFGWWEIVSVAILENYNPEN